MIFYFKKTFSCLSFTKVAKLKCLVVLFIFFDLSIQSQILINGDFESGTNAYCGRPDGYICINDAGRVVDGVHPVFTVGDKGCAYGGRAYSHENGAYSGTGYVLFLCRFG